LPKPTILVIDDDPNSLFGISQLLIDEGFEVVSAKNGSDALKTLREVPVELVVTDERMPGMTGMDVLEEIQKAEEKPPVILMTAYGSVSLAVEALKKGAFYFFEKPVFNKIDQFLAIIRQALKTKAMERELDTLRKEVQEKYAFPNIIGNHPGMQALFEIIGRVAQTEKPVLIEGESGTGKDLIARTIHYNSVRRDKQLVSVNCGALTETLFTSELFGHAKGAFTGAVKEAVGRFQAAEKGTLVLEEIGEIPFHLQKSLLRVLEEKEFEKVGSNQPIKMEARIISTTNRNLREEVVKGNFREDLFYRISVVPLTIPPLRKRVTDIPFLIHHFLRKFQEGRKSCRIDPEALQKLQDYSWPGNVRELANVVQHMMVFCREHQITQNDLPSYLLNKELKGDQSAGGKIPLIKMVSDLERKWILFKLKETGWNKEKTAKLLGITRKMLSSRLDKYRIKAPQ
jgi:two-component system NtrC family response regulator